MLNKIDDSSQRLPLLSLKNHAEKGICAALKVHNEDVGELYGSLLRSQTMEPMDTLQSQVLEGIERDLWAKSKLFTSNSIMCQRKSHHISATMGLSLYRKCQNIWKSTNIPTSSQQRTRIIVAGIALGLDKLATEFRDNKAGVVTGLGALKTKFAGRYVPSSYEELANQNWTLTMGTFIKKGAVLPSALSFLNTALPALAIITDAETLTYVFNSSSEHYKRIADCLPHDYSSTASEIQACLEELPPEESPLKHTIRRLHNYLCPATPIPGDEEQTSGLTKLIVDWLGDLQETGKALKASAASPAGGSSTRRSESYTSASDASNNYALNMRTSAIITRSQSRGGTDSSDRTDDSSYITPCVPRERKKQGGDPARRNPRSGTGGRKARASTAQVPVSRLVSLLMIDFADITLVACSLIWATEDYLRSMYLYLKMCHPRF